MEKITTVKLILSTNRALLCEIRSEMRKISVEYVEEQREILLYFYYNTPPSEDELDEDFTGVITAEMSCDFPFGITFKEEVIVLPYPDKLPDKGTCVYRRYEPSPDYDKLKASYRIHNEHSNIMRFAQDKPGPEITKVDRVLAFNQASQCLIHPNMREIDLEYIQEQGEINFIVYFDSTPTESQVDDVKSMAMGMRAFLTKEVNLAEQIIVLPYPNKIPSKWVCVYARHELDPELHPEVRNDKI